MNEQSFDEWLSKTQKQRDALFEYAKTEMPTDPGWRSLDIDKSLRASGAAGVQLADCQYFLTQRTAQEMSARSGSDSSAKERELIIKDAVKDIQRLYDYLEVATKVLNSRVRAGCNARRSLL